jgi:replicative DNA helicase
MEINDDMYKDLVGICLVDNQRLPYITTKIKAEDLPNGALREVYKSVIDLYNLGVEVDIVTVSNRLLNTSKLKEIGGRAVVNELALNAPSPRYTKKIVEEVLKQTSFRKLSTLLDDFKKEIESSDSVNNTCIDYCGKISSIITGSQSEDKLDTISAGYDEVISDLYESRTKGCIGLDSGFPTLNLILGGLQKGKMYIIGARPSMGKSALAMNISEHISKDSNVLFISLEMSKKEYAQRLMFSRAGVDVNKVNSGEMTDGDIERVKLQKEYLDGLNLFIETKTPCKVSDIELAIINLQSTKGSCDLVVVDYLQLLSPTTKGTKNREVEVAEISRELKSLAVKYNVPIIVLSQLSRALESREDKRPMLSDLRESGAIEQDADVVMFVYRDEWYNPDNPMSRGRGELLVRKNRGGVNNRDVYMCWQPSRVKFTEEMAY